MWSKGCGVALGQVDALGIRAGLALKAALAVWVWSFGAVGCAPRPPSRAADPPAPSVALETLTRPCALLSPEETARALDLPFVRTLAADQVAGGAISCAQALGHGGIEAIARLSMPQASGAVAPELAFASLCRPQAAPDVAALPPPPGVCQKEDGGYAILFADRVGEAVVESASGVLLPDLSRVLAADLAARASPGLWAATGG